MQAGHLVLTIVDMIQYLYPTKFGIVQDMHGINTLDN